MPTLGHAVPTGPHGRMKSNTTAFGSYVAAMASVCACSPRRGHDWTDRVPLIARALTALRVKSVTLDGEGVVCRADGVSQFDRMRAVFGRLARV